MASSRFLSLPQESQPKLTEHNAALNPSAAPFGKVKFPSHSNIGEYRHSNSSKIRPGVSSNYIAAPASGNQRSFLASNNTLEGEGIASKFLTAPRDHRGALGKSTPVLVIQGNTTANAIGGKPAWGSNDSSGSGSGSVIYTLAPASAVGSGDGLMYNRRSTSMRSSGNVRIDRSFYRGGGRNATKDSLSSLTNINVINIVPSSTYNLGPNSDSNDPALSSSSAGVPIVIVPARPRGGSEGAVPSISEIKAALHKDKAQTETGGLSWSDPIIEAQHLSERSTSDIGLYHFAKEKIKEAQTEIGKEDEIKRSSVLVVEELSGETLTPKNKSKSVIVLDVAETIAEPTLEEQERKSQEREADVDEICQDEDHDHDRDDDHEREGSQNEEDVLDNDPESLRPVSVLGPLRGDVLDFDHGDPSVAKAQASAEYYEYLLAQRHASSVFITQMDSIEQVYGQPEKQEIKMVGPYIVGEQVGKGSFGKVKEGFCSETLQRIAVKIVSKKRLKKVPDGVPNALREIKLLRRLKHKNVIRLLDVWCKVENEATDIQSIMLWESMIENQLAGDLTDSDATKRAPGVGPRRPSRPNDRNKSNIILLKWYLVFEFCPGTLQNLVDNAPKGYLPASQAQKYFRDLMDGIQYLHSMGVVHRDIKPGNLLISRDGTLKVTDFGVAEILNSYDQSDACHTFSGTHQFLSPEVTEGITGMSGIKVDIWACGVTLYNMITGKYPFVLIEGNILGLYESIMAAKFDIPPERMDVKLASLMKGMLCKDPVARYDSAQILGTDWMLESFPPSPDEVPLDFALPGNAADDDQSGKRISIMMRSARTEPGDMEKQEGEEGEKKDKSAERVTTKGSDCSESHVSDVSGQVTSLTPYLRAIFHEELQNEQKLREGTEGQVVDVKKERKRLEKKRRTGKLNVGKLVRGLFNGSIKLVT